MPTVQLCFAFALLFATACGDPDDHQNETPDASTSMTPDAPPVTGDCSGSGDRFVLNGAVTVASSSLGPITVEGNVAGWAGALGNARVFAFSKRRVPLDGDFESVGVHDISTEHVKFIDKLYNADCSTAAGGCTGFFALSGSVTITSITPRFVATFALADLYARTDDSNNLGQAMAGTITGCVDSRLDP